MLNPAHTNKVTCTVCGWSRILDPYRAYRGGHTRPDTSVECHEMLRYEELSPLPPEIALLGETVPRMSEEEISSFEEAEEQAFQRTRNADIEQRLAAIYELVDPPPVLAP